MCYNKIIFFLAVLFTASIFSSCTTNDEVSAPTDFNISVDSIAGYKVRKDLKGSAVDTILVHVNDVVNFRFTGKSVVDQILFYSGEAGFEYRYKNRFVADTVDYKSGFAQSFKSTTTVSTTVINYNATQAFNYSLIASNNLSAYSKAALKSASWTTLNPSLHKNGSQFSENAITDLPFDWLMKDSVQLAIVCKSANAVANGINFFNFNIFNYETRDYSGFGFPGVKSTLTHKIVNLYEQAYWVQCIPDSTVGVLNNPDYKFNVGDFGVSGRSPVDSLNLNSFGKRITTYYPIQLFGRPIVAQAKLSTAPFEGWLIMRKYNPRQVFPDSPTNYVKTKEMNNVSNCAFTYKNLGVYKATFVAVNTDIKNVKSVVREVVIVVQ